LVTFSSGQICSGVLIAADRVVTAAHCFEDSNEALAVEFETPGGKKDRFAIEEAHVHPDYEAALRSGKALQADPTLANFDVATLKLAEEVTDRTPVPIYGGEPLAAGKLVALIGYGDTGLGAGVKRFAQSHVGRWIEDEDVLGSRFRDLLLLDSTTGTGACPGDSGGGVFVKTPDGYQLIGVVDGVNDVLYPGFPVSTCDRCPQGIGVVTRLANHAGFLRI
jgi:trypsin